MSRPTSPETDAMCIKLCNEMENNGLHLAHVLATILRKASDLEIERNEARNDLAEIHKDSERLEWVLNCMEGLVNNGEGEPCMVVFNLKGEITAWKSLDLPLTSEIIDIEMAESKGNSE